MPATSTRLAPCATVRCHSGTRTRASASRSSRTACPTSSIPSTGCTSSCHIPGGTSCTWSTGISRRSFSGSTSGCSASPTRRPSSAPSLSSGAASSGLCDDPRAHGRRGVVATPPVRSGTRDARPRLALATSRAGPGRLRHDHKAGHPEAAFLSLFTASVYGVARLGTGWRVARERLIAVTPGAVAGLLLAAPEWINFAQYAFTAHSVHPGGGDVGMRHLRPAALAAYVFPNLYGRILSQPFGAISAGTGIVRRAGFRPPRCSSR